jgi:hypothetical protein
VRYFKDKKQLTAGARNLVLKKAEQKGCTVFVQKWLALETRKVPPSVLASENHVIPSVDMDQCTMRTLWALLNDDGDWLELILEDFAEACSVIKQYLVHDRLARHTVGVVLTHAVVTRDLPLIEAVGRKYGSFLSSPVCLAMALGRKDRDERSALDSPSHNYACVPKGPPELAREIALYMIPRCWRFDSFEKELLADRDPEYLGAYCTRPANLSVSLYNAVVATGDQALLDVVVKYECPRKVRPVSTFRRR